MTVIQTLQDGEYVVLSQAGRTIQLQISGGSVLNSPIEPTFRVENVADAGEKMRTLNRFLSFLHEGRIPPAVIPPLRTAQRWNLALKVYPLVQAGKSDREVAAQLYPQHDVRYWSDSNDWIRTQVRRARLLGQYLVGGGYRTLLSKRNSDRIPEKLSAHDNDI